MVLVEAARLSLRAFGCEINPVAFMMSGLDELYDLGQEARRALLDGFECAQLLKRAAEGDRLANALFVLYGEDLSAEIAIDPPLGLPNR